MLSLTVKEGRVETGLLATVDQLEGLPIGTDPTQIGPTPRWVKIASALGFASFSTAATTLSINLFVLPAGADIHEMKMKHSTSFLGGAITAYTISVGIAGTVAKYAAAFDVFQAVSGTAFQLSHSVGSESHTATTQIIATATSTTANLNAATQGAVDIWALLSKVL